MLSRVNFFGRNLLSFVKNLFALITLSLLVSACAGTGTKSISDLSIDRNSDKTRLFFFRPSAFVAGAVTAKILVNGSDIGTLGVTEYLEHEIKPQNFSIKVDYGTINGMGMGTDSISGVGEKGKSFYYLISVDQGLFSAGWKIIETTKSGFRR